MISVILVLLNFGRSKEWKLQVWQLLILLSMLLVTGSWAAQVSLPDGCNDGVCLVNLVWKEGHMNHSFSGELTTKRPIESVEITAVYDDGQKHGKITEHFTNVEGNRQFKSELLKNYVDWQRSKLTVTAIAIIEITPVNRDGVRCVFRSLGSRLSVKISNDTPTDMVFDYSFVSLISGTQDYRLNASTGKYVDLATPKPSTLIPAGTEHMDELIPVEAVKFYDSSSLGPARWIEDWVVHRELSSGAAVLVLPLGAVGTSRLEKIPYEPQPFL